ncbi:HAD superfamily hydrolase (TIGR01509 family) [Breznakia blatticola]|uniref:HAD superfamily hydrolase (TIGR01509 family) n=1 Tax=Breznakia blatticola TaxID=1754012 RepID=A0A4R8A610_9FIRM|nr:HAD family phosphatase [Breznakia blatticola]TDW26083.1 HAD superfamily hydrolase (TIGR01509 family) [Breznakia blatticola]
MNIDYKAVIFDFNGTLFFDNDKHIKAWGEISKKLRGIELQEAELLEHINGVPNNKVIQYMLDGKATAQQMEQYSLLKEEIYRDFCKKDTDTFHLVKGSVEYFDKLKSQNIPFTIASASIKENIDFFIESFGLDVWIQPSDIIFDDGTYKNKVAMFKNAAKKLHTPIEDILVIEDSISGIKNAAEAGCRNIVVVDSANQYEIYKKLPYVKKVIKDFTELV